MFNHINCNKVKSSTLPQWSMSLNYNHNSFSSSIVVIHSQKQKLNITKETTHKQNIYMLQGAEI